MPRHGFGARRAFSNEFEDLVEAFDVDLGLRQMQVEGVLELLGMSRPRHLGQGLDQLLLGMKHVAQMLHQGFVEGIGLCGN
jgi:hypothetical protein